MRLSDFVSREAILVDLKATAKEEAIREIVRSLHDAGRLAEADMEGVTRAILNREELGSLLRNGGLEGVKVTVGARKAGDPFTVLVARGTRPQEKD